MRFYFARHGESEANVKQIFWDQPDGYGLTEKGKEQAAALADSLSSIEFAGLYCSPILRAVQTAEVISKTLNLPFEIDDGLRERSVGIMEGQKINKANIAVCRRIAHQWREGKHDVRFTGGESYDDIAERFMMLVRKLEDAYRNTDANILLISHGQTLCFMLPHLLSNIDLDFSMVHTFDGSFYAIAELRDGEWVCLRWGDEKMLD